MKKQMTFQRCELKYLLTFRQLQAVLDAIYQGKQEEPA